ncbi:MAG: SH3 domain-containing protein, partial [Candidatus Promineifilaceae bacterium]
KDIASATPNSEAVNTPESPATPQLIPTATPTTPSNVAWVNSVNGLWLREEPSIEGQEIELIPNETMLILLRGKEPPDLPEWQQVRVPSGNEGWVFIEYLLYSLEQQ